MERFLILRESNKASAPLAAVWSQELQRCIEEDGDLFEFHHFNFDCEWLYAVRIATNEPNFTDEVKKSIIPQMCGDAVRIGPAWKEVRQPQYIAAVHEIGELKKRHDARWSQYEQSVRAADLARIKRRAHRMSSKERQDWYVSRGD